MTGGSSPISLQPVAGRTLACGVGAGFNGRRSNMFIEIDRAKGISVPAARINMIRGVSGVVNLPLGALTAKAGKTFCTPSWVKAKEGA